jgi:hypothetical protein
MMGRKRFFENESHHIIAIIHQSQICCVSNINQQIDFKTHHSGFEPAI